MMTPKRSIKGAEINRTSNPSVMKYIGTLVIVLTLLGLLGRPQPTTDDNKIVHLPKVSEQASAQAPEPTQKPAEPTKLAEAPKPEPTPAPQPAPKPAVVASDCVAAMQRHWPEHLWAGATIVIQKESSNRSNAIGTVNRNGSQDFGCFQINNHAHANWFNLHNWQDADQNSAYAYQLYRERGNWTAWYAVQGILW